MHATSLSINLRNPCNAKCPFCISRLTEKPDHPLDAKESARWAGAVNRAMSYAKYHGVDTVLITSSGEPLLDMLRVFRAADTAQRVGIPIIEVQTNGTYLSRESPCGALDGDVELGFVGKVLQRLVDHRVTTVAISAASTKSRKSAGIMGLDSEFDYLKEAEKVVESGMLCRITLNLNTIGDPALQESNIFEYMKQLRAIGVHQLTIREIGVPCNIKEGAEESKVKQWIERNKVSVDTMNMIFSSIEQLGTKLRPLSYGGWVYDFCGVATTIATCMTEAHSDEIRSLILQPDGHVYHSWNYRGSVLL